MPFSDDFNSRLFDAHFGEDVDAQATYEDEITISLQPEIFTLGLGFFSLAQTGHADEAAMKSGFVETVGGYVCTDLEFVESSTSPADFAEDVWSALRQYEHAKGLIADATKQASNQTDTYTSMPIFEYNAAKQACDWLVKRGWKEALPAISYPRLLQAA